MAKVAGSIKDRMASLSDESLIKIVTKDTNSYEDYAIQAAREEIKSRGINLNNPVESNNSGSTGDSNNNQRKISYYNPSLYIPEEVKVRMSLLNDESLIKLVTEDNNSYEDYAIQAAINEAISRNIDIQNYIKHSQSISHEEQIYDTHMYIHNNLNARWVFKNLFLNYRALLILMGLEFIMVFTFITYHSLPQIISETVSIIYSGAELARLYQLYIPEAIFLVIWICVISGMLSLYRKSIMDTEPQMRDFGLGITNNWKKLLIVGVLFTLTFDIIKNLLYWPIHELMYWDSMFSAYLIETITLAISFFYTALFVYGSLSLIEKGANLKKLFLSTLKFIVSKNSFKVFAIAIIAAIAFIPISMIKNHYYFMFSESGGNLFSFFDTISKRAVPNWLQCIEWLANTIILAFIILYTSVIFYRTTKKK